ncbi:MAG TPA: hypothetical protein VL020_00465 [Pseudomonadales bacterium]|nr:hypothetical protein [Pseudomonadales bacterium]
MRRSKTSRSTPEDHDSPWKSALEVFFRPFMDFLYPHISVLIDWQQPVEFLDKELQKITRSAKNSRRYADKLVKVHFLNGSEKWILIHIEIQGASETDFAERMFIYYRIRDRYQKPVISLAVLTDTQPSFRPNHYHDEIAGCSIRFEFATVKLLDWKNKTDELLHHDNPFGLLIAAQLTAKLIKDGKNRVDNLIGYYRLAAQKKLPRKQITQLVVFLEWIVALPEDLTPYYNEQLEHLEEDNKMTYISIIERQGIEQGIGQGRAATLYKQLQLKFNEQAAEYEQRLFDADNAELNLWTERVLFAESIEAVFAE